MARKKTVLLMTVGTGIGGSDEASDSLAHGIFFSIDSYNPDIVIFFGSHLSKKTIDFVEKHFFEEHGEPFDFYEFIQIEDIDNFKSYFEAFKAKINDLEDYKILIDYTSGTKTMTMAAAFASMLYGKKLFIVSGERENGIVIKGTEKIITQNLYPIYDDILIAKIKEMFNTNRFEAGKALLEDVTKAQKETYLDLFDSYYYFDNVDYKKAQDYFNFKKFVKEWPDLKTQFEMNSKALSFLNRDDDLQEYYVLGSLINNARRRAEENKYDDAIARLYRSLELIAQIKLKKEYGIDTSDVDLDILKEHEITLDFIPNKDGTIKTALVQDYILLNELNDELGKFFMKNNELVFATISSRNNSILAHGLNSQSEKQYTNFKELVLRFAKVLNPEIKVFIDETMFPEFEI